MLFFFPSALQTGWADVGMFNFQVHSFNLPVLIDETLH